MPATGVVDASHGGKEDKHELTIELGSRPTLLVDAMGPGARGTHTLTIAHDNSSKLSPYLNRPGFVGDSNS